MLGILSKVKNGENFMNNRPDDRGRKKLTKQNFLKFTIFLYKFRINLFQIFGFRTNIFIF